MKLLESLSVPKNTGRAVSLRKGQHSRIIAESIVDFIAYNLDNLKERFEQ